MQPETEKFLYDIRDACAAIAAFTVGKGIEDYMQDALLRSAIERQFITIGEAATQIKRIDENTAERIAEVKRIIGFRNVLVHGYSTIKSDVVWNTIVNDLPSLHQQVESLINEA